MTTPQDPQAILNGPALIAPPGVTYQFKNPPNLNTMCLSTNGIFLSFALVALSIRIYTKWIIAKKFTWEDYFLILGSCLFVAYSGLAFKLVFQGAGVHQWNIQVKNISGLLYNVLTAQIIYGFAMPLIKMSITLQYLRFFHPPHFPKTTFLYIGCWTLQIFLIVWYTVCIFLTMFVCTPRAKFWKPLLPGQCMNISKLIITTGSFNVASDFLLVLLPQYEIWKLHISLRKKAAVSALFLVAFCACIVSGIRLYYSIKMAHSGDISYNVAYVGTFTLAEVAIAIVCSCVPLFPKFFKEIGPKVKSYATHTFTSSVAASGSTASRIARKRTNTSNKSDDTGGLPFGVANNSIKEDKRNYELGEMLGDNQAWPVDLEKEGTNADGGKGCAGIRVKAEFELERSLTENHNADLNIQQPRQAGW